MKKHAAFLVTCGAMLAFAGMAVANPPTPGLPPGHPPMPPAQGMPAGHPPIAKEEVKKEAAKPAKKVKKAKKAVKKDAAKAADMPAAPAVPAPK